MKNTLSPMVLLLLLCLVASTMSWASDPCSGGQYADPNYTAVVTDPAYEHASGPLVVVDQAHNNFHTVDGRFSTFAQLLAKDGYRVESSLGKYSRFTAAALKHIDILVIANAVNTVNVGKETCMENWVLPTPSAFDKAEIAAVKQWVIEGGSLLLMADHMPFAGAAEELADEFGITLVNGFTYPEDLSYFSEFHAEDGTLQPHAITAGRPGKSEAVDSVTSFIGEAFLLQHGTSAQPLMIMGEGTRTYLPANLETSLFDLPTPRAAPNIASAGMLQGAVLNVGKGKLAMFGEAGMFSAQVSEPEGTKMGMNNPRASQNSQFVLNVMHWLSGLLIGVGS